MVGERGGCKGQKPYDREVATRGRSGDWEVGGGRRHRRVGGQKWEVGAG